MIEELDVVALLVERPDLKLSKGSVGTVVAVFGDHEAFEVEFVDPEGQTYGLETFPLSELLKLHHRVEAA
ncbi:MAG TPA: DUF4926 domain-containing protein [Caulobacter sp.]|nr:DUF4926 domain-containing protein [Caulobacter sp.]